MYDKQINECNRILESHGIPVVDINIEESNELLSYTYRDGGIFIGRVARALDVMGCRDITHTIMHEIVHNLTAEYPVAESEQNVFGTPEEWEEEQKMIQALALDSTAYVTRYAMTHPDEDFVETVTCLLLGETVPDTTEVDLKLSAVKRWMETLKQ